MHPALAINTQCLAEAPFAAQVEQVAAIGATAISPTARQVHATGVKAARSLIRDAGLAVAALTPAAFSFATAELMAAGRSTLNESIETAAEIGATNLNIVTGGRGALAWNEAADRFVEAIAPCVDAARSAGVTITLEQTSHLYADLSIVQRLADTALLARRAGIGLCMDVFACWFDADIEAAIVDASDILTLVQVSDHVEGDRALPCRAVPGDGMVPLDRLIPLIVSTGFRGYFDLEIIGPRLIAEGPEKGLRRGLDWLEPLLSAR